MQPEQSAASPPAKASRFGSQAFAFWSRLSIQIAKIPATGRVLLGLFLLAAVLMVIRSVLAGQDSSLRLKVQHGLRSAQLSLWIDGDLTYSGKLIGAPAKRFGLLPGFIQGSLSETFPVSSGSHQLRVRVVSDDGVVQENSIKGDFTRNSQCTLAVTAHRNDLSLSWQGGAMPIAESVSAGVGWFSRYAGTLLMTVAGSIISALTGYMIRELPKQIGSRTDEIPKI